MRNKKKKLSLAKAWRSVRYNRRSGMAHIMHAEADIVLRYTRYCNRLTAIRREQGLL